ncbi:hypothetical protein [Haloarchaeobius sp. TZWWS8]|uniref:hypothetical protein n=1 Tax=Haloarchaeobius sp. TZWWS8 TaxID=3446121 RepID=UPI003EC01C96
MVSRRTLLGSFATALAGGVTLSRLGLWPQLPTVDADEPPVDSVLCQVEVMNEDEEPHTVSVTVEQDDELVTRATRDLGGTDNRNDPTGFFLGEDLPTDPGQFVLTVTVDGEHTVVHDSREDDPGAHWLYAFVEEDGEPHLFGPANPLDECPPDTM